MCRKEVLMKLYQLLDDPHIPDPDREITSLALDSRDVRPGAMFFCLTGDRVDGHDFADDAARRGAAAIVHRRQLPAYHRSVVYLHADDPLGCMNRAARRFYGDPSSSMTVYGV